ncbi:MAG: hypothetical protein AAF600_15715, partial [Bacteroidota bacterium]
MHFYRIPRQFTITEKEEKHFTRNRSLSFACVVIGILHLFKESVEFNMLSGSLQRVLTTSLTGSAFSLARYKLRPTLFSDLCSTLLDCDLKMTCKKRW